MKLETTLVRFYIRILWRSSLHPSAPENGPPGSCHCGLSSQFLLSSDFSWFGPRMGCRMSCRNGKEGGRRWLVSVYFPGLLPAKVTGLALQVLISPSSCSAHPLPLSGSDHFPPLLPKRFPASGSMILYHLSSESACSHPVGTPNPILCYSASTVLINWQLNLEA